MILIIRDIATAAQITDMLETLGSYIKLAVGTQRGILAGGGEMHADCEAFLLEDGSAQRDIWGADWDPKSHEVEFQSLINIRPGQNNPSMKILDKDLRATVERIAVRLLGKP